MPGIKKKPDIRQKQASPKTIFIIISGLVLLTVILFSNSIKNDFVDLDDPQYIKNNYVIKNLSSENIKTIFTSCKQPFSVGNYHPLTTLANAVEYKLWGLKPARFHAVNLFFHILNVILVFFFIYLLTGKMWVPAIVSLLFAIHPMHVESVSWISELKDVMYSFFYLGALISYIYYLRNKSQVKFLIICFILFVLSLLSKSAAVSLPLLLLLLDYYKNRNFKTPVFTEKIPFFIMSFIFGIVAITSQKSAGAVRDLNAEFSLIERIFVVCYSTMFYVIRMFAPVKLSALHPYPERINGMLPAEYYIAPVFVLLLIFLIYKAKKHKQLLIFGTLFFLITISLVLQVIPVGQAVVAERYSYIPYIGLFLIIAQISSYYYKEKPKIRPLLYAILGIYIVFFSVTTWNRNKVWANSTTLFDDVIKNNSNVSLAYNNKAVAEFNAQDYAGAIKDYDKAIELRPRHPNAYCNRGAAKYNLQDYEGALKDFNKALEIDPTYAEAYKNRGVLYYRAKNYAESVNDYTQAIKYNPTDPVLYYYRGVSRSYINDMNGACEDWNKALSMGEQKALKKIQQYCK